MVVWMGVVLPALLSLPPLASACVSVSVSVVPRSPQQREVESDNILVQSAVHVIVGHHDHHAVLLSHLTVMLVMMMALTAAAAAVA
jgi:hypothetical protein